MDIYRVTDSDDLEAPLHPARTLLAHVAAKSVQLGSALGLAVSPVVALYSRRGMVEAIRMSVNRGSLLLFLLTSGAMAARTYSGQFDAMSVDDRAYRIALNKGQRQLDAWSMQAACGGLICGTLAGSTSPGTLVAWSLTGVALSAYTFAAKKFLASPKGQKLYSKLSKAVVQHEGTPQT